MAKNLRALTDEELEYVNQEYIFDLIKDSTGKQQIIVSTRSYPNRKTLHDVNNKFIISTKQRKVTISKEAIQLWINEYRPEYSLIEVQNAISTLIVTYQGLGKKVIDEQLERKSSRIENKN